jgi:glycosidase
VNVETQRRDPHSLLSFYRRLTAARRASLALRLGSYRTLPAPGGVFAFLRELDSERVFVALNFSSSERTVAVPFDRSRLVLSTDDGRAGSSLTRRATLSPDEGVIASEDR